MKRLLAILLLLCGAASAQILTPILMGKPPSGTAGVVGLMIPAATTVSGRYFGIPGVQQDVQANAQIGSPVAGQQTEEYCNAATAPSSGNTVTMQLLDNDTGLCAIGAGVHQGSITGRTDSIGLGDRINGKVTTASTTSAMSLYARIESVTAGVTYLPLFTSNVIGNGTTYYFAVVGYPSTTEGGQPLLTGGTLDALYVGSTVVPGTGTGGEMFYVCDATTDSSCSSPVASCLLPEATLHTACTSLGVTLTSGDRYVAKVTNNSGSNAYFGLYARITGASAQLIPFYTGGDAVTASTTAYFSGGSFSTTAIGDVDVGSPIGGTITGISCNELAASTTGGTFTLNLGGSATSPAVACSTDSSHAYCSATGFTQALTKGELMSVTFNNTATGARAGCTISVTGAN